MSKFIAKFLFSIAGAAVLVNCGVPGVPKPPSLALPQPVTDLRAVRKGDRVYLVWTVPSETTDRLAVRHPGPTRICRSASSNLTDCSTPAGEVPPEQPTGADAQHAKSTTPTARVQASYTDTVPQQFLADNPGATISYAVTVLNANGRSAGMSNVVQVPAVVTVPPPSGFRAQVTADGIILSWAGIQNVQETQALRHLYRVYRRSEGGTADSLAGEAPFDQVAAMQLVDHSFEWEQTYSYRATTVTLIHEEGKTETQFESGDTPAAKVFAHDVFPPAVPSGLQAVFSGVGQPLFIDLIWTPDSDADLAGYNVFRHEAGGEAIKINSGLGKTPAFRDTSVTSRKMYFYSVSAVDVRGNESARSQEASEAVP